MFYTSVIQRGNRLFVSGFDKGLRFRRKVKYKPYIFLKKEIENSQFRTLFGDTVTKRQFESLSEARDFIKTHSEISNFEYYGLTNFPYLFIYDFFKGNIDYDANLINVSSIDIETSLYSENGVKKFPDMQDADHEITAITLTKNNKSVTFGCGDYIPENQNQIYIKCLDEYDLLMKFVQTWESDGWMPDIITGWNIDYFDMIYISNRIIRLFSLDMLKRLSPWKMVDEKKVIIKNKEIIYYVPSGIAVLDYLTLYKKFTFTPREEYTLNFISSEELGLKKLDYSEFSNLEELYLKDYQKFISYNIRDCFLVDRLEDKLKLIKMVMNLTYTYKCNYEDVLGTVKPWDMFIHHYLMDKGIVIPQFKQKTIDRELAGGFVKDIIPGLSEWIVSFDVKSSYPHQIMEYNISPETLIIRLDKITSPDIIIRDKLEPYREIINKNNYSVAGNLCCFIKEKKGFMPEIMEMMFAQRAEYQAELKKYQKLKDSEKTSKYDNLISEYDVWQQAKKISINAFYGMLANEWCRWYNIDLAEAITLSGQLTVKWILKKINEWMNNICKTNDIDYIVAGDTDSNYISFKKLLEVYNIDTSDKKKTVAIIEKICNEKLDPYIRECFLEMHEFTNSFQPKIRMARENIADRAIWTAKKHYILNVLNTDGKNYDPPKLKMVGIETVKSSTPAACRQALKDCINIIMNKNNDELIEYIKEFKKKHSTLEFEHIAFPRGVNGMEKYKPTGKGYLKSTPVHVKGSLLFNRLLKEYNITDIPPISSGEKIKFCYLKVPNPAKEEVISTPKYLPKEFRLDIHLDREKQYNKSFLDPLKSITNVIGWKTEKIHTLQGLFGKKRT